MALLRIFQSISNDVWTLTFLNDPDYLSDGDKRLMKKFGEPEIDMGGTFLSGEDQFILPAKKAKIRSDFPFTQTFDSRDTDFASNTKTKVEAYRDAIVTRFTTAIEDLRASEDTFSGERTYNI